MKKPKVFIGSSVAAVKVAEAVQVALVHDSEPVVWNQSIFRATNTPIEDLMEAIGEFDFAVFVFLPEDKVNIRGEDKAAVRDNVIFELGLFLGALGRRRVFFVAPKGVQKSELHLPSDLSGITAAEYDPTSGLHAAVSAAIYHFKQSIRSLGPFQQTAAVLYDSGSANFKPYHFHHKNAPIYQGDKAVTPVGEGNLTVSVDREIRLDRTNTDGRNEIELRPSGKSKPTFPRVQDERVFAVSCEAKAEGAEHTIVFVAKDIERGAWADSKAHKIPESTDWLPIKVYLMVPSTADVLFRLDDQAVSKAPSTVLIRNLLITQEP